MSQKPPQFRSLESNASRRDAVRRRGSPSVALAFPLVILFGVLALSYPVVTSVAATAFGVAIGLVHVRRCRH